MENLEKITQTSKVWKSLALVWATAVGLIATASSSFAAFGDWTALVTSTEATTLSTNIGLLITTFVATITVLATPLLYKYFGNRLISFIEWVFWGRR